MRETERGFKGHAWGEFDFRLDYDYSPRVRPTERSAGGRAILRMIERDGPLIRDLLRQVSELKPRFEAIDTVAPDAVSPCWDNPWLPAFDCMLIYTLIATRRPKHYLEIGSGNSTKFARRAIEDHGLSTEILSIDPHPRAEIDGICDESIRSRVEDADIEEIAGRLTGEDVVFIDNSHRSFQNSDVTVCLTELVPALPGGCLYGVHDVNLPFDYPAWYLDAFYNEQYLLAMYLIGGASGDRIVMPSYYASHNNEPDLEQGLISAMDLDCIPAANRGGCSFWLARG